METKFYKADELPEKEKGCNFSIEVLIFCRSDLHYYERGSYDYNTKSWDSIMHSSMNVICWCHIPDPSNFIKENNLK